MPLLVNLQPAGEYLGEDYHRAGGVPAVMGQLIKAGMLPHPNQITANGKSMGENCTDAEIINTDVIKPIETPIKEHAGFINLSGNLFDSAIMKTSASARNLQIAICPTPTIRMPLKDARLCLTDQRISTNASTTKALGLMKTAS